MYPPEIWPPTDVTTDDLLLSLNILAISFLTLSMVFYEFNWLLAISLLINVIMCVRSFYLRIVELSKLSAEEDKKEGKDEQ